jgi:hypothetical protein
MAGKLKHLDSGEEVDVRLDADAIARLVRKEV